jgi:chemotaxis protein methyltransferase CheR
MLTGEEFRLFRNLIYKESGIYLRESRQHFLENRLIKRMKDIGVSSPYWYYKMLTEKTRELITLLDILTVNETSFFRNRPQFKLLKSIIIPEIMLNRKDKTSPSLRIWSAGCSTGEEPYSIAMIVSDLIPNYLQWDIKIFASDLSLNALDTANSGTYNKDKVLATVDDYYLSKYFTQNSDYCKVKDSVKDCVVFDYHNMKHDNGLRDLDIIFCRNVMIYFDADEQKRVVNRFYNALRPGGYLFIGHAESLQGWKTSFEFIYNDKGTAYRKPNEEKK